MSSPPDHQPSQPIPDVEEEEIYLSGQEEDDAVDDRPDPCSPYEDFSRRPSFAGKRPRSNYGDEDPPDLGLFFDSLDVPLKERILMCRSYASYLASQMRTSTPSLPQRSEYAPRYGKVATSTHAQWKKKTKK